MNTEVDPEQMNKTHWTSQTNEQYACSVFVCSLPTLRTLERAGCDMWLNCLGVSIQDVRGGRQGLVTAMRQLRRL
jgi:hypothetical protein